MQEADPFEGWLTRCGDRLHGLDDATRRRTALVQMIDAVVYDASGADVAVETLEAASQHHSDEFDAAVQEALSWRIETPEQLTEKFRDRPSLQQRVASAAAAAMAAFEATDTAAAESRVGHLQAAHARAERELAAAQQHTEETFAEYGVGPNRLRMNQLSYWHPS